MDIKALKSFLDLKVEQFNQADFISSDPISIPHLFTKKQDIEISGLFAAVFAWGLRKTIINKSKDLLNRMDNAPYDFILNHSEKELQQLAGFKHRTFNETDLLYFVEFLKHYYKKNKSLETAFSQGISSNDPDITKGLISFNRKFFSLEYVPQRSRKHIPDPLKNSSCKRINMYLRWMVRKDNKGVDFGIWKNIKPSQLLCPFDVHVSRVSQKLGLINKDIKGFKATLELTRQLRLLDSDDPVKYDFALFGMGVEGKLNVEF